MKILYLSAHSILEYDEIKLFSEMGHDVFSMGAYQNNQGDGKRPPLTTLTKNLHLQDIAIQCSKENIHPDIIEWADVVISMHNPKIPDNEPEQPWIVNNWHKMKQKRVIWRSIGQSTESIEHELKPYRDEGLQVVRYSPLEDNIPGFIGSDAMIRFYKDPEEYTGWNGKTKEALTFAQSMNDRGEFVYPGVYEKVMKDVPGGLYGRNNDRFAQNRGEVTYEQQLGLYRSHAAYFYLGTYPASYTLTFIESLMTGTPVVAIGPKLADLGHFHQKTYEIPNLIQHGVNGFIHDDIKELRACIKELLTNAELAKKISEAGRRTALSHFGKEQIKDSWRLFLQQ